MPLTDMIDYRTATSEQALERIATECREFLDAREFSGTPNALWAQRLRRMEMAIRNFRIHDAAGE